MLTFCIMVVGRYIPRTDLVRGFLFKYMVFFPDIEEAVTQGDTIADCIEMAEDVLCLMLYERELNSISVPAPSDIHRIEQRDGDIVTLIKCDTMDYRRFYLNKAVKKTL